MSKQGAVAVGLIGGGNVSTIYLKNAQTLDSIESVACAGIEVPLPVPQPMHEYLRWFYGDDWTQPTQAVAGRAVPREYVQKGMHCPALDPGSRPAALNRALLSLLTALHEGWVEMAAALCWQILAMEPLDEVQRVQARLSQA